MTTWYALFVFMPHYNLILTQIQERLTAKEAMAHPYFHPVRQAAQQNNSVATSS
jgi:hypothetical protein